MALARIRPDGGEAFQPVNYLNKAYAFLIEVRRIDRGVDGKHGVHDVASCGMTVFTSKEELHAGKAAEVIPTVSIHQKILVRDLEGQVGQEVPVRLDQVPTKNGNPAWVWRDVDNDDFEALERYIEARDGALEEVPPF